MTTFLFEHLLLLLVIVTALFVFFSFKEILRASRRKGGDNGRRT